MIRRLKKDFHPDMVRPLVYKVFTRGVLALFLCLGAALIYYAQATGFQLPVNEAGVVVNDLSLLLGLLFALFSLLAWLRLDGLRIPQLKLPRMKRKDPPFLAGSMADHIDDDIVSFDDLSGEEQNLCVLLADLFLTAVCLVLAAVL